MRDSDTKTLKNPGGNQNSMLFCTIAYQAESGRRLKPISKGLLLIVLKSAHEGVRFFVDPLWQKFVDAEDVSYLQDIFDDLPRRAKDPGDNVFEQLCELSVGPLATLEVGEVPVENSSIMEMTAKFTQI
jgi:hypothetical protein